jgi:uncharacterized protein (TIGR03067 family)
MICALVVLTAPVLLAADNDAQKEYKALQGKWKTVGGAAQGMPFPPDNIPPFSMNVAAEGKATGKMLQEEWSFTMKLDPSKSPPTIENSHESGTQKGKKQYGIYKLEGDKFTVCMTPPGKTEADRPKDFNTKDTFNVVFIFERVKEEKKP